MKKLLDMPDFKFKIVDSEQVSIVLEFWSNDNEFGLFLLMTPEEEDIVKECGINQNLLDWMQKERLFKTDGTTTMSGDVEDMDIYTITQPIIDRFMLLPDNLLRFI